MSLKSRQVRLKRFQKSRRTRDRKIKSFFFFRSTRSLCLGIYCVPTRRTGFVLRSRDVLRTGYGVIFASIDLGQRGSCDCERPSHILLFSEGPGCSFSVQSSTLRWGVISDCASGGAEANLPWRRKTVKSKMSVTLRQGPSSHYSLMNDGGCD